MNAPKSRRAMEGVPAFDVGPRTDVLDACPKAEGMMMMIRSLSPQVLVVDEIGRKEDADAIVEAMHAGIRVIATAHGKNMDEIRKRPDLRPLLEAQMFGRYVVLEGTGSRRKQSIYDRAGDRSSQSKARSCRCLMIKLLGAILIIGASTLYGFYRASLFAERPRQIRGHSRVEPLVNGNRIRLNSVFQMRLRSFLAKRGSR